MQTAENAGEISASIEETNRIRAQLGLKPLVVEDEASKEDARQKELAAAKKREEEQKEAEAEALASKLKEMKRQRAIDKKTSKKKGLGEASSDEDDSAAAWIIKSKQAEEKRKRLERLAAERKARELEARDDEEQQYDAADLAGMKLSHTDGDFTEGSTMVLTLKDAPILKDRREENSSEDELENVNLAEQRRKERAVQDSKRKSNYDGTDDHEFELGADGKPKAKPMLSKYDDMDEDKGLVLGKGGKFNAEQAAHREEVKRQLEAAESGKTMLSLDVDKMQKVRDFYTKDEMATFRKKKKKVVRRKRRATVEIDMADQAMLDAGAKPVVAAGEDHGSRALREEIKEVAKAEAIVEAAEKDRRYKRALQSATELSRNILAGGGGDGGMEAEEDEAELAAALARARRAKVKTKEVSGQAVSDAVTRIKQEVKEEPTEEGGEWGKDGDVDMAEAKPGDFTFTSTTEFCRGLRGTEEKKRAAAAAAAAAAARVATGGAEEMAVEEVVVGGQEEDKANTSAWQTVDADAMDVDTDKKPKKKPVVKKEKKDSDDSGDERRVGGVLTSEPVVAKGIMATLAFARQKDMFKEELAGRSKDEQVKHYAADEATNNIRIDRVDEFGREMTTKEAWRHMCWNFHGIKPGRKKLNKRIRQVEEERKLKKAMNDDSQIVNKLQNVQARTGQAHVPITGSAASARLAQAGVGIEKPSKKKARN